MNLTDQLCYEMTELLLDAPAPLSVVFPEARMFRPETRAVDIGVALDWLQVAATNGWLTLTVDDGGRSWPYRPATASDLVQIAEEYRQGLRDANEVRQILNRFDVWLEISPAGREAVNLVWPDMPPGAEFP